MNPEKLYEGAPCKYGHGTARFRSSRACVECARGKAAKHYASRGRAQAPIRHRLAKYGLDASAFAALLEKQHGTCAICRVLLAGGSAAGHGLAVDHCHTTGRVRGLLCNHCNRGLGLFHDDPAALLAAAGYLTKEPIS